MKKSKTIFVICMVGGMAFLCACSSKKSDDGQDLKQAAIDRYNAFIGDENNWPDDDFNEIRADYGYIDEDDIPELFICCGTYTVCGMHIYKYDVAKDDVIYLGEFSQYGFCKYTEKQNRIWAQYGGGGYFENYYYEISGDQVKTVGRILCDQNLNDFYYADYSEPAFIDAKEVHTEPAERPGDQYIISEEEFDRKSAGYMKTGEPTKIGYDDLKIERRRGEN